MKICATVWKDEAAELATKLGLKMSGAFTTITTEVTFTYRSIEGHPKVVIDVKVP